MSWLDPLIRRRTSHLTREGDRIFQVLHPEILPITSTMGGFACQVLCGKQLRRPHLSCLTCRTRRAYYGRMPNRIEVDLYVLNIWKHRRFARAKDAILKRLLSLCEVLAN